MEIPQHVQKVGAHSNQETRPCDSSSPRPTVAPDSQPPLTRRKRKERTLSPEQRDSQQVQRKYKYRRKRRRGSDSSWDRAEQLYWDSLSRVWRAPDPLKELDRRNALLAAKPPHEICKSEHGDLPRDVVQFARHGGPDLSDIRQVWKLLFV